MLQEVPSKIRPKNFCTGHQPGEPLLANLLLLLDLNFTPASKSGLLDMLCTSKSRGYLVRYDLSNFGYLRVPKVSSRLARLGTCYIVTTTVPTFDIFELACCQQTRTRGTKVIHPAQCRGREGAIMHVWLVKCVFKSRSPSSHPVCPFLHRPHCIMSDLISGMHLPARSLPNLVPICHRAIVLFLPRLQIPSGTDLDPIEEYCILPLCIFHSRAAEMIREPLAPSDASLAAPSPEKTAPATVWVAISFAALFLLLAIYHSFLLLRTKAWFTWTLVAASITQCLSLIANAYDMAYPASAAWYAFGRCDISVSIHATCEILSLYTKIEVVAQASTNFGHDCLHSNLRTSSMAFPSFE